MKKRTASPRSFRQARSPALDFAFSPVASPVANMVGRLVLCLALLLALPSPAPAERHDPACPHCSQAQGERLDGAGAADHAGGIHAAGAEVLDRAMPVRDSQAALSGQDCCGQATAPQPSCLCEDHGPPEYPAVTTAAPAAPEYRPGGVETPACCPADKAPGGSPEAMTMRREAPPGSGPWYVPLYLKARVFRL